MGGFDVTVECLKEHEDGQCEERLSVHVVYEAPEYEMGYLRLAGGWYVDSEVKCPHHALTQEEEADIIERAIEKAQSDIEDDYDGPDRDDMED